MQALNTFFKDLADKMSFPSFFKESTLLFNNLFLTLVALVSLTALLLVIFLIPFRRKKNA